MKTATPEELRRRWFTVHLIKTPIGRFEVTIDGIPTLKCSASSSDEALSMAAQALQRLESAGAAVPDRGIYLWEEYVSGGLWPMGKMPFSELPLFQRFLRKNSPTMWDKMSANTAYPLASGARGEDAEIPGEEIVWHHVWALTDELTPSERQERIAWSGYPDLHF